MDLSALAPILDLHHGRNKEPGLYQPYKPGTCGVDVRTLRVASQRFVDSRKLLSRSVLAN